jgi:CheY-like chemotaxis protein
MTRILVVDDDSQVRATLRHLLEAAGHEVAEACDGLEAVRIFQAQRIDVVLCDLLMPKRDGLELIRDLRRASGPVRVVAMSGTPVVGDLDILHVAELQGAVGVLLKPFNSTVLLAAIERAMAGSGVRDGRLSRAGPAFHT